MEIVVGLEIHTELLTETKAYCSCKNSFGAQVNSQCCEVCLALPGALPQPNERVVEFAILLGTALGCKINTMSKQDRKNYFYPDLAKSYQISQAEIPLCEDGMLEILVGGKERVIGIERIHIEEDTAKLLHDEQFSGTLIDFNRSSVPLLEIVTRPDFRSAEEVRVFLETLRRILMHLSISDGKMQEGSIRCDVNVSVREEGGQLGTRVEMKNVNTFSGAENAVHYESKRQMDLIAAGETVKQETRRWDDTQGVNVLMRSKEDAADYRYFPDPDLGVIYVTDELVTRVAQTMPELPNKKHKRYVLEYGISEADADLMIEQKDKTDFFEAAIAVGGVSEKTLSNWILGDVTRVLREEKEDIVNAKLTPEMLADMVRRIEKDEISNASGKIIIEEVIKHGKTVEEVIAEKGLSQISDTTFLSSIVDEVIAENSVQIAEYHAGKTNILGYLVGQCMKKSKGQGNPGLMKELLLSKI